MDNRTICEILNHHLSLDLTTEDLSRPTSERVQNVYRGFIIRAMDIQEQSMVQLPLDCCDDAFDAHPRSIPLIILLVTMKSFVADYSTDNTFHMSMCDLIQPHRDVRRTKRLFMMLADYLRCHLVTRVCFEEVAAQHAGQRHELEAKLKEVALGESKKTALLREEDGRKRRENELLTELGRLNNQFASLVKGNNECEARRVEYLKVTDQEKYDKAELSEEKESLAVQLDHLSKEIIDSPEEVLAEREQQRLDLLKLRESCDNSRRINSELNNRIQKGAAVEKLLTQMHTVCSELEDFAGTLEQKEAQRIEVKRRLAETTNNLHAITESIETCIQAKREADENQARNTELQKDRLNQLNDRLVVLESDIQTLKSSHFASQGDHHLLKEIAAVRLERKETLANAKTHIGKMSKNYGKLITSYNREKELYAQAVHSFRESISSISKTVGARDEFNATGNTSFFA